MSKGRGEQAMQAQKQKMVTIDWKPDRQSKEPIYAQIVSYISHRISSGDWGSGQTLPSQRKLSELFGVNRSTIVEAMDELASLGLIESSYGGGTHIASGSWSLLMQDKAPDWQSYIRGGSFRPNVPTVQMVNHLEFEEGIIRMSTGELSPDLMQTAIAKQVLSNLSLGERSLFMNYPDPLGLPSLREALRRYLQKIGIDVPISSILIVSGALQALQLISTGIVQPGAKVCVEAPSYLSSLNIFQSVGARLCSMPMDEDGPLPWMSRETQNDTSHALLYTIPTFQNPTGIVMPMSRREKLLKYCNDAHIPIIEDDVFRDLWLDAPPPPPIKSLDGHGNVVYIGSLSKCFAPGLRLGWLVGPEAVVQRLADVKMQMDYGVSVLTQQVAEELLETGLYEQGVQNIRSRLAGRRDFMMSLLERYFSDLAEWSAPSGSFFVWVRLKNRVSAEKLFNLALQEKLLIMPGGVYDRGHSSSIRLTYGYLPCEEMERGVRTLSSLIRTMR